MTIFWANIHKVYTSDFAHLHGNSYKKQRILMLHGFETFKDDKGIATAS